MALPAASSVPDAAGSVVGEAAHGGVDASVAEASAAAEAPTTNLDAESAAAARMAALLEVMRLLMKATYCCCWLPTGMRLSSVTTGT